MDLNHIDLPAFVVAELYHSSLIETNDSPAKVQPDAAGNSKKQSTPEWKWLGDNKKNILVVVEYPGVLHLPEPELDFLTGILAACKLTIDDVAIVNMDNHSGASYKEYISFFKTRTIFLFAVDPVRFGLPMSFPHFQLQSFSNNSFLFVPSLHELKQDKVLKSKLWVCLRRMFGL